MVAPDRPRFARGFALYASPRCALFYFASHYGPAAARRYCQLQRHGGNVRLADFSGEDATAGRVVAAALANLAGARFTARGRPRYRGGEVFLSSID